MTSNRNFHCFDFKKCCLWCFIVLQIIFNNITRNNLLQKTHFWNYEWPIDYKQLWTMNEVINFQICELNFELVPAEKELSQHWLNSQHVWHVCLTHPLSFASILACLHSAPWWAVANARLRANGAAAGELSGDDAGRGRCVSGAPLLVAALWRGARPHLRGGL